MAKIVKVHGGHYKVQVDDGYRIYLDVGPREQGGGVYISGNLYVEGTTTQVKSETVVIRDNIISLNNESNPTHAGVTLGVSGLEINRGTRPNAQFLFNENAPHKNAAGFTTTGTFTFTDSGNNLLGIQTTGIDTKGGNLYLIGSTSGATGYVTTYGVAQYERKVFDYTNYLLSIGPLELTNDVNAIPNTQAVKDYVDSAFLYKSSNNITDYDTSVTVSDLSSTGFASQITFEVDNNLKAFIDGSGVTIDSIKVYASNITSLNNNTLTLSSANAIIEANARMLLDNQNSIPSAVAGGTYLYANATIGAGKSGLYIVNTTTSDELVSKNRALLFSMIF